MRAWTRSIVARGAILGALSGAVLTAFGCSGLGERASVVPRRERAELESVRADAAGLADVDTPRAVAAAERLAGAGERARVAVPALVEALEDGAPEVRRAALDALGTLGPEVVAGREAREAVRTRMEDGDLRVRIAAARASAALAGAPRTAFPVLADALRSEDADLRVEAARALGGYGAAADGLQPSLRRVAETDAEPRVRMAAWAALARVDPQRPPRARRFLDGLAHDDRVVRALAAEGLEASRCSDEAAIAALHRRLREDAAPVRRAAAGALARAGATGIRVLTAELDHSDPGVREDAARGLGEAGSAARDATPRLLEALGDPSWRVRAAAAEALGTIGPALPDIVPALLGTLEDDGAPRDAVRRSIVGFGAVAVPELDRTLGSESVDTARWAAECLVEIGPVALAPLAGTSDVRLPRHTLLRARVEAALARDPAPYLRVIAEGLESEDPGLRAEAARALGALGEVAAPFVPELTAALADSDASVRVAAIDALGRGGAAARRAVPVLSARLVNGTEAEREAVTDAFARLGPFADAGVDGLLRLLRDGDPGDRIRAARALAAIGPAALPAVPELEERIARRDAASAACARALGQIGPAASGSLDTLVARASTADGDERTAICEALGGLLPVDERVAEILLEASREGPVVDRRRAARALLRVATHADRSEWILPLVHHDDPRIAAWAERRLATVEAAGGREPADATEDRAAIRAGNGASP